MRGTAVRNRLAVAACGLGIVGSLVCSASPAFALTGTDETKVSIVANDETNLKFEAPAELPFAVNAEGELIGPDAEHLQIKNLSTFGIHIVNVKTEPRDYLNLVSDVSAAEHAQTEDLIDFQFGPEESMIDASEAATETGLDTQFDLAFNMSQMEGDKPAISLKSQGNIARWNDDISSKATIGHIVWTAAAGNASVE